MPDGVQPKLSLIVLVTGESRRAEDLLFSLAPEYQRNVASQDYEIVVVESASSDPLGQERAVAAGSNVHHVLAAPGQSAVRLGVTRARASFLGLLFDGTTLLTPRVVEHALLARRLSRPTLALLPEYGVERYAAAGGGVDRASEAALEKLDWRSDGYKLFTLASLGGGNPDGFLCEPTSATCVFLPRDSLEGMLGKTVEGVETADLRSALLGHAGLTNVTLAGEGVFHRRPRPEPAKATTRVRESTLLGAIPGLGRRLLRLAVERVSALPPGPVNEPSQSRTFGTIAAGRTPRVSILVIVYRIPRQAENTLRSLSVAHQLGVSEEDYEIVVVENSSDAVLGEDRARAFGRNVRYFYREERGVSPAPAVNFAFACSRAPLIALMIDGAHMVTPGLVRQTILAAELHDNPLVAVTAYHLGKVEQHLNRTAGYSEEIEQKLLESVDWKADGYALFSIACWSGANYNGCLCPAIESNCIGCTRQAFESIGRADVRFDLPGGGVINQDIFASLSRISSARLVVFPGEGSFHQYHGGVSTSESEGREELLQSLRAQYQGIRGHAQAGYDREPLLFGKVALQALPFLKKSAELGVVRHLLCVKEGRPEWPNN